MVTPLVRSIWNYMGWSNGGEVALSLSHGLLILYFIISQYVRRYEWQITILNKKFHKPSYISCTGKELQHLLCEILSRLSVLKISNTGFVETNTPRFTLIVIATCPRQVERPKSTHPPPRWSCLGAFQGEMRERHLAGNSETAMFYYFAPHRVGLVGERAMVILKVSMRQCSHQLWGFPYTANAVWGSVMYQLHFWTALHDMVFPYNSYRCLITEHALNKTRD